MPQFERRLYEPSEDARAFDSDEDMADEGSRLPLLIGIALIVLLSFAGVVWLAYSQGVERGRADTPRVVASADAVSADRKPTPYSKLKIYQAPKSDEEVASEDAAPPPTAVAPPDLGASKSTAPTAKPDAKASALKPPPDEPKTESSSTRTSAPEPVAQPATGAPRVITPTPATAKPAKSIAPPAKTPDANPTSVPANKKPDVQKMAPATKAAAAKSTAKSASTIPPKPATVKNTQTKAAVTKSAAATTVAVKPPATAAPVKPEPKKLAAITPAPTMPATSRAATPAKEAPVTSGGGYVLQIGSYKSDSEANSSWQTYKGAHSSVAGYSSDVRKVELGAKGTWFRLRVGPFASLSEANAACAKLKAQGGNCFPAKQ